ncbi:hypothetical protein NHP190003_13330 [Helicobacter sp. NHP19-003]|uniref:Mu-like prophage I protein n=1 Tax=Helicobacter gastrocanis TaxID=2849641 RepID=A0ABM7SDH7_9HELI|nr:phage protease [Helicobacter sp. NHP19-003]BCZ18051.1 hypothetical protein NHP190003_13330 [Helicobacter sp. NHP19-003]
MEIMLTPLGVVKGLDGRVFRIDPSVFERLKAHQLDIPVDIEHTGGAVGWVKNATLTRKNNAIYGQMELNPPHTGLLKDKTYRYLSPTYLVDSTNAVQTIVSLALVNTPNILKQALNNIQGELMELDPTPPTQDAPQNASTPQEAPQEAPKQEGLELSANTASLLASIAGQIAQIQQTLGKIPHAQPNSTQATATEAKDAEIADLKAQIEALKAQNAKEAQAARTKRIDSLLASNAILKHREADLRGFEGSAESFESFVEIYKLEANAHKGIAFNSMQEPPAQSALEQEIERQLGAFGFVGSPAKH